MKSLRELRDTADAHLLAGEYESALHAYGAIVRLNPLDLDPRLRIADTLLAMGEVQNAARVYTGLARHAAHAGYPLRALVALKVLEALDPELGVLLERIARLYSLESDKVGVGTRLSLGPISAELPEGAALGETPPRAQLVEACTKIAGDTEKIAAYPEKLPPLPLFSQLPAAAFAAVLGALKLVRARPGQVIVQQGEVGTSFFVLARGDVKVSRTTDAGDVVELATLHDGSIFGEMALLSAQPRTATVTATDDSDLLEFDKDALAAASSEVGIIAAALDKFARERLLSNLLATSALFQPLDRKQRIDLVRRFSAHDVPAGTPIIREGEPGRGLFVVLSGQVDVSKVDGEEKVLLATLGQGSVFGEIALIHDEPTTATVTAAAASTVLFLSRELFQKLLAAFSEIRDFVEGLGEERLMDTRITMSSEDFEELDDDDLIMI